MTTTTITSDDHVSVIYLSISHCVEVVACSVDCHVLLDRCTIVQHQ